MAEPYGPHVVLAGATLRSFPAVWASPLLSATTMRIVQAPIAVGRCAGHRLAVIVAKNRAFTILRLRKSAHGGAPGEAHVQGPHDVAALCAAVLVPALLCPQRQLPEERPGDVDPVRPRRRRVERGRARAGAGYAGGYRLHR